MNFVLIPETPSRRGLRAAAVPAPISSALAASDAPRPGYAGGIIGSYHLGRAEPSRAEPSRAEPSRAEPSRAERFLRLPRATGRRDAVDRDFHGRRASAPDPNWGHSRPVTALARRAAGTLLLATFALLAFAPEAEAQAPGVPTDVEASGHTTTSIRITWSAASGNVGRYQYQRKLNTASAWPAGVTSGGSGDRAAFVSGLQPATSYDVRIRACDAAVTQCSTWVTATGVSHAGNRQPQLIGGAR